MTATHTPGPWYFHEAEQFGDTRFYVAQQEGAPYTPDYSDVATLIAETVSGERVTIQRANARLIAAAPDLLKQLADLLAMCERQDDFNDDGDGCMFERAQAAINKATGAA